MNTYIVKRGDTLTSIATLFKTTVQALMSENNITNPNIISVGQVLEIPLNSSKELTKQNIQEKVKDYVNFLEGKMLKRTLTSEQISNINHIFQTCLQLKVTDLRSIAYILATTQWETARTFRPIDEMGRGRGKSYGIPHPKTGKIYYGRGFVQLTWYDNYERFTRLLNARGFNVDLINKPEQANNPEIASLILVLGMKEGRFTGRDLDDYFNDSKEDWYNARRIVNGTDKAVIIKDIALETYYILK